MLYCCFSFGIILIESLCKDTVPPSPGYICICTYRCIVKDHVLYNTAIHYLPKFSPDFLPLAIVPIRKSPMACSYLSGFLLCFCFFIHSSYSLSGILRLRMLSSNWAVSSQPSTATDTVSVAASKFPVAMAGIMMTN